MGDGTVTRVYLVRHAEAEGNVYHVAQGHFDGMVTKRGYRQIEALRRRFKDIPVDAVYASPLHRTRETAKAIYEDKHLPLNIDPSLIEINFGPWEGKTWYEIDQFDHEQLQNFFHHLRQWNAQGIEPMQEAIQRFTSAMLRLAKENEGKSIALVSHGAVMRVTLQSVLNYTQEQVDKLRVGDNTCVSLLEIEDGQIRAVYVNDNSHLEEERLFTVGRQFSDEVRSYNDSEYYLPLSEEDALDMQVPENGERLAICAKGQVIGAYQVEEDSAQDCAHIGFFYLKPKWRNLRLGTPPLGRIIFHCREHGIDRLTIDHVEEDSIGFFQKFGFNQLNDGKMILDTGFKKRYM